ncbi:hypothetical protein QVD17_22532 [Tagetes erecta]|uniref:Uncharacterized protein n=1 Tax=Tagetes erecta TaxID=13708 RepID=A0AAD8KD16_TARER|nr:hypothetical protein QVD17_22532 [Tagetes erecta]
MDLLWTKAYHVWTCALVGLCYRCRLGQEAHMKYAYLSCCKKKEQDEDGHNVATHHLQPLTIIYIEQAFSSCSHFSFYTRIQIFILII